MNPLFEEHGEDMDEPWTYGTHDWSDDRLEGLAELIKSFESGDLDSIDKSRDSEWYRLKYDYGGEYGRRIENAIHNNKSEPRARKTITVIAQKMKSLGTDDAASLAEWLQEQIKAWVAENEQTQQAAEHQTTMDNWRQFLTETVKLDIEVGDVVLGGKYKNKRIVVKDIGTDELGQPTINGKTILKFRIEKFLPDEKKSKKTKDAEQAEKEKDDDETPEGK